MKKLINLLLGYVEWQISGAFPERMLNLCAQHRLQFWHLRWLDNTTFVFRTALRDSKRVEELAQRAMCSSTVLDRKGGGAAALAVGRRWGFLLGLAVCLAAVSVLSQFLLVVEVEGNDKVSTAVILTELRRLGVCPGAYGPSIDEKATANEALLALPDLAYVVINIQGTRAAVTVREKVKPPELLDETVPADIVAAADGIITEIRADGGRALFQDGDIVAKGEVLITGVMDLKEPEYGTVDLGYLVVRALGSVRARTWRTLEEKIPLKAGIKSYTGTGRKLRSLQFFGNRFDFYENSSISWERYDKITTVNMLTVGSYTLPVGMVTTSVREYTVEEGEIDQAAAAERLTEILHLRLDRLMDANDGTVLRCDVTERMEEDLLVVTLLAECEEEIGRTVELPGEVGPRAKE